jgi:hypothetical protein
MVQPFAVSASVYSLAGRQAENIAKRIRLQFERVSTNSRYEIPSSREIRDNRKAPVPGPSARWHSAHPGRHRRARRDNLGAVLSMPDDRQRAINDYSTGIVTTMGAVAGYSNGTDTQDEFVVLDAW